MSFRERIEKIPIEKRRLMMWIFVGVIMAVIVLFFILHWSREFSAMSGSEDESGFGELVEDLSNPDLLRLMGSNCLSFWQNREFP